MKDNDFRPVCYIFRDKYIVENKQKENSETYYLPNGIRTNFFDTANCYVFRQNSLYGNLPNKTIKIYKDDAVRYIIINRVGRIRISRFYEEPS